MAETVTPLKALDEREQAIQYHRRQRALSHRDLMRGLFRTHAFDWPAGDIGAATYFGGRDRPITFTTRIEITAGSPNGMVLEIGNTSAGMFLALDSANGTIEAGAGGNNIHGGASGTYTPPGLDTVGARFALALSLHPALGVVELWVNGESGFAAQTSGLASDDHFTDRVWAPERSNSVGNFGQRDPDGRVNTLISHGPTLNVDPSGFALIEPLSAFQGQLPRFFQGRI